MASPRVVIVSAWIGCGKTTAGDYLAANCGFKHVDIDADYMMNPEAGFSQEVLAQYKAHWGSFFTLETGDEGFRRVLKRVCDDIKNILADNPDQRIVVTQGLHRQMRDFIRVELAPETVQFVGLTMSLDRLCERSEYKQRRYFPINFETRKKGWKTLEEAFEQRTGKTFSKQAFREEFMASMNVDKLYLKFALDEDEIGTHGANIDVEVEANAMLLLRSALSIPEPSNEIAASDVAEQNWVKMRANLEKSAELLAES